MLLSSVIIILREVMEAAILTSLLLALSYVLKLSRYWFLAAFALGVVGAVGYAQQFDRVAEWLDGVGQELLNATLHVLIYACLLLVNVFILLQARYQSVAVYLQWSMMGAVSLAITREGVEIYLYLSGFATSPELFTPVMLGGVMGGSIGVSMGILIYYAFISLPTTVSLSLGYALLLMVAGNMISQAVRLLMQVDWLPGQPAAWNTSDWIREDSITGQLLYALIGYEATPTPIEVQCYLGSLALILLTTGLVRYVYAKHQNSHHRLAHVFAR